MDGLFGETFFGKLVKQGSDKLGTIGVALEASVLESKAKEGDPKYWTWRWPDQKQLGG